MSSLFEVRSARYQPTWAWVVLGLLTALGFALRVSGHDQSLGGDEYYTQTVITASDGVVSLLRHVRDSYETTPPLYFDTNIVLKSNGSAWTVQNRQQVCAKPSPVPASLQQMACNSN